MGGTFGLSILAEMLEKEIEEVSQRQAVRLMVCFRAAFIFRVVSLKNRVRFSNGPPYRSWRILAGWIEAFMVQSQKGEICKCIIDAADLHKHDWFL